MSFRILIALCSLAAAGCATQRTAPTQAPAAAAAEPAPAPSPPPPDATVAEAQRTIPSLAPAPAPSAATSRPSPSAATAPEIAATPPANPPAAATKPATLGSQAATAPTGSVERPAVVTAAPNSPPAPVDSKPPADTLDFTSLGARLRTTKAIGVLTKLSVKNQADDLLEQFREYHKRQGAATLPDLRRAYDMLVLKMLSLLQDGDPPLATDISRSRAAIWDILSDQRKFIESNLMVGTSL